MKPTHKQMVALYGACRMPDPSAKDSLGLDTAFHLYAFGPAMPEDGYIASLLRQELDNHSYACLAGLRCAGILATIK